MEQKTINAAAFFIKDEEGKLQEAGMVSFKQLHNATEISVKVYTKEAADKMRATIPPGGYRIVDGFSNGRIELVAVDMDNTIPFRAVTSLIDSLRSQFNIPPVGLPKTKTIAIRPNPAKS